jgi:hypothetical protein
MQHLQRRGHTDIMTRAKARSSHTKSSEQGGDCVRVRPPRAVAGGGGGAAVPGAVGSIEGGGNVARERVLDVREVDAQHLG